MREVLKKLKSVKEITHKTIECEVKEIKLGLDMWKKDVLYSGIWRRRKQK